MRQYLFIILSTVLIFFQSSYAQIYNFELITVKDGLSQSQVESFCMDELGNLWVGTRYGGLNVFNGKEFTQITEKDGLPERRIRDLLSTPEGNIYIATDRGLYVFNGQSFIYPDSLNNGFLIWQLSQNQEGVIFIASEKGLIKFNDGKFENLTQYMQKNEPAYFLFNGSESIFFYWNNALHQYKKNSFSKYKPEIFDEYLIKDGVFSNNSIWLTTNKGLLRFKNDSLSVFGQEHGLLSSQVKIIEKDLNGNLWIGYEDIGLSFYNGKEFISITKDQGLRHNYLNQLFIDKYNRLWLGFNGGGFALFKGFLFRHYEISEKGVKKQVIMSVFIDQDQNKWLGTDANGLVKFEGKTQQFFKENQGLVSDYINDILKDENGTMWVATQNGLAKSANGKFEKVSIPGKEGVSIVCLMLDQEGSLYLGTMNSGAIVYDGKDFRNFTIDDGLAGNIVWDIFQAGNGLIYFATDRGFSIYNQHNFVNFTENEGLVNNSISTIIEDQHGNIWIGTDNGVSCFNGKEFKNYFTTDGLLSNVVYLMIFDDSSNLWIGAEKGINKLKTDQQGNILEIESFTEQEGFTAIECNHNAVDIDAKGQIWFGTINGVTVYNPKYSQIEEKPPEVYVSGIKLFYKETDWSKYTDSLYGFYKLPKNLSLPKKENNLTFEFAGIDLEYAENIQYSFKLEGLDEEWSPLTQNTFASYTNIPPGEYTFLVKAKGKSQLWSESAAFSFVIEKPFWQQIWFYMVVFIVLLLAIYFYIRLRTRKLSNYSKDLEDKVKERTFELGRQNKQLEHVINQVQEATRFKEMFIANTSHEIRTPLNAILGFANLLLALPENSRLQKQHIDYLKNIKKSGDNLLVIINDILDFSKIEAGKLSIEKTTFDVRETIQNVVSTLNVKAHEKRINFNYEVDESIPRNLIGDPHRISQILINLTGNAIKFTNSGGKVELLLRALSLTQNDCQIEFVVKDNGIGIPEDKLHSIFESYQQAEEDTTRNYGGTGLGLTIVKNLVELMDGTIKVKSEQGKGSEFKMVLGFEKALELPLKDRLDSFDTELYECHPKSVKILLVEDNLLNKQLAVETIRSWNPDFTIETAENGKIAIEKLEAEDFNMIFMDLQMPEMDGYQAIEKIRSDFPEPKSNIPIIAMSAHAMKQEKERCFALGVNEYAVKPFNPENIFKIIKFYSCPKVATQVFSGKKVNIEEFKCVGKTNMLKKRSNVKSTPKPKPETLPKTSFKHIDLRNLIKMNAGDDSKVIKLLNSYLNKIPEQFGKLKAAYEIEDWENIKQIAHAIKPSMFYLGLNTLFENMKLIEKNAEEPQNRDKVKGFILESSFIWEKAEKEIHLYINNHT